MQAFESTEQMYDIIGSLLREILADETIGTKYRESDMIIKYNISGPTGEIWVTKEGEVICGATDNPLAPSVAMTLSGDSCHAFWMQELSLPMAVAKGKIKVKGSLVKVLKLIPLLKPAYKAYPEIARKYGMAV
ncbi:MAG: hypothetical protein HF978_12665 [Desulfobacteraceae bacterium]|nr:SCP2 sterol-binding domain-containing protein [Desulfobacteraceae bacterium]MBC2756391.1 hypothetical protein [Desulfobacteraceae bacterium]